MNLMEGFIIASFVTFSGACMHLGIIYVFLNKVFSKKKIFIYILAFMFFCLLGIYVEKCLSDSPWAVNLKAIISIISVTVCTRIILKIKWPQIVITTLTYLFVCNLAMALVSLVLSILGLRLEEVKNSFSNFFVSYCIMDLLILLFLSGISLLKRRRKLNINTDLKIHYFKNFLPNIIIIVLLILINSYLRELSKGIVLSWVMTFTSMIIQVSFLVISIVNLNSIIKLSKKDREMELQIFYNEKMKTFMDEITRVSLNFNNTILILNKYIELKEWDKLECYYKELFKDAMAINCIQSVISLDISCPALLGLVASKMEIAAKKNMYFYVDINEKIGSIDSGVYFLCDILGCLIDNAIEAAEESIGKHLNLKITMSDRNMIFRVENSYKDKPDINDIFCKGISSKGEGRGNGLWYIKEKIDKEENYILNTLMEKNYFVQELIVLTEITYEVDQVFKYTEANEI